MPSIAINIALLVALVFTCGFSFAMLREFRRFRAHAGEYGLALHEASQAMARVDEALARTHDEGARTAITLGERLDAAQRTLDALKATEAAASAQLLRLRERIHEARDVAAQAESAIRMKDASESNANGNADGKGRRKAGGNKAVGSKAARRSAAAAGIESVAAEAPAMAAHQGDAAQPGAPGNNHGTLALAPAEKPAQNAPRTRKILSWPVIRSAGIAAGA
ncbi:MAG: hypothetical protein ACXIVD_00825 [Salinarimonas sp.]